jgi:hypothetical protein
MWAVWNKVMDFRFHRSWEISWLTDSLLASVYFLCLLYLLSYLLFTKVRAMRTLCSDTYLPTLQRQPRNWIVTWAAEPRIRIEVSVRIDCIHVQHQYAFSSFVKIQPARILLIQLTSFQLPSLSFGVHIVLIISSERTNASEGLCFSSEIIWNLIHYCQGLMK